VNAKQIRARFLEFFAEREHTIVSSSSLVPQDDPTLIFTNAGMNQFKAVFMGMEKRDYVRATSCQKCMRVSGKHNDLEEVGRDARHHTFFEMLGNWSFGDYAKKESLLWGWEFLIKDMGLNPDVMWASVYKDDDESYAIWRDDIGLPESRIKRLGDLDKGDDENFWSMGDVGPCGPCSEIHVDQGEDMSCDHADGCALGVCDCDRWLEIWNHVFMEFNRDEEGALHKLPMQSVDTGMGLERLVAVCQGVRSNFESDLFTPLIEFTTTMSRREPVGEDRIAMQIIADHARAVTFAVADGAAPGNDGKGYVVRRILRRAARAGRRLDLREPFLWKVAMVVIREMGGAYPELLEQQERILKTIRREEERFNLTLDRGLQVYAEMKDSAKGEISGVDAFKLHDTFGFPLDLTRVIAEEDGLTVDEEGFKTCMEQQRAQSGKERSFMAGVGDWVALGDDDPAAFRSEFTGYDHRTGETRIVGVRDAGEGRAQVLFSAAPFYAESGGQVGDRGTMTMADGVALEILDTLTTENGPVSLVDADAAKLAETLKGNASVTVSVADSRDDIMRHHTATHLLHSALRQVLGEHVAQAGSDVAPDKLRFDFHHDESMTAEQLAQVELLVNREVLANSEVIAHIDMPIDEARERGATALFGEKYGDHVRMIEIAGTTEGFSLELCGGTHVPRTGDIGAFRVTGESSSAAGIRRIEAIAGTVAQSVIDSERTELATIRTQLRGDGDLATQIKALQEERDGLANELQGLQRASAAGGLDALLSDVVELDDLKLLCARVDATGRDDLMQLGDRARDKLVRGVAVLAAEWEGKATLLVTVTPDLVDSGTLHAGNLVKAIAAAAGGRGGGRPNTAQAGLPDSEAVAAALTAAPDLVREHLQ